MHGLVCDAAAPLLPRRCHLLQCCFQLLWIVAVFHLLEGHCQLVASCLARLGPGCLPLLPR
jgi:hypothetical protein